jgi:hypothetical protein
MGSAGRETVGTRAALTPPRRPMWMHCMANVGPGEERVEGLGGGAR